MGWQNWPGASDARSSLQSDGDDARRLPGIAMSGPANVVRTGRGLAPPHRKRRSPAASNVNRDIVPRASTVQIRGLGIAMDDPQFVRGFERFRDLLSIGRVRAMEPDRGQYDSARGPPPARACGEEPDNGPPRGARQSKTARARLPRRRRNPLGIGAPAMPPTLRRRGGFPTAGADSRCGVPGLFNRSDKVRPVTGGEGRESNPLSAFSYLIGGARLLASRV
jgi:hypothetical protein